MRTYEALYIVRPDLKDDEVQAIASQIESMVTGAEGVIVRSEVWGKRKLAYKVKHFTEGSYILLRFESDPALVSRLTGFFRLSEQIIRHLIIFIDEVTLRLEAEQIARREAEALAGPRRRTRDDDDDDEEDDRPRRGRDGGRRRRDDDDDDDDAPRSRDDDE